MMDIASACQFSGGPVYETRVAMASVIDPRFFAAHARVISICWISLRGYSGSLGCAVVSHEDQYGVFCQVIVREPLAEASDVFVDVCDHAVESRALFRYALLQIRRAVFFVYVEWAMGGVGGDVTEEWGFIRRHKLHGFVKPYVCAIAGVLFGCAVSEIGCGKVVVVPVVRDFSNYAAAETQGFSKSPVKRAIGIVVAQMPFAKDAGAIARVRK